ncbi:MAG: ABC transporter permease [Saprospiraceae bacterium]|nr:ABC transporter permease [Saprospiraceae bacterium]MBK6564577.1 ABC transporter permease [Saprospiraceae bacterium]MBK7523219.1 ABC transporter permease [Saprospiraceae bacterium]MBK8079315.1 ABC transporter permease [Saprospiraceae bacterium]MBK8371792.1 ABC transporter permease [Saprospiraceae bacterium]
MSKIWLITQREYLTRVLNKTFILTTLLTPLGFLIFFIVLGFIMNTGSDKVKNIIVSDRTGILGGELSSRDNLVFEFSNSTLKDLFLVYEKGEVAGILELSSPPDTLQKKYVIQYYADEQLGIDEIFAIEKAISKKVRNFKLKAYKLDEKVIASLDTEVTLEPKTIKKEKNITSLTTIVSSVIGGIVGYALFFIILLYGSQVMRSVMEEKINRIIEVLISSVKPFELMMGKVLGVGLVGLTQIGIWIILIPALFFLGTLIFGIDMNAVPTLPANNAAEQVLNQQDKIVQILAELKGLNWWKILPLTLVYFFLGYFAYSALFAAVGSAVGEDINEAQSLTMPIMLPLIFAVYIGFSAVQAPDSSLAVYASMIPLLSSIVMPVRLPFDPPIWQIIVSISSLIVFTIFLVWLAGRIYRVGILMYGKKATFKEIWKWMVYKDNF